MATPLLVCSFRLRQILASTFVGFCLCQVVYAAIYTDQVTGDFRKKIEEVANRLEMDPDHLVAVIALETAKPDIPGRGTPTFDPAITNSTTKAVGLIQFMPKTAQELGTSTDALAKMTAIQQMDYVEKYLKPYKGKMTSLVNAYLAVFLPGIIDKPDSHVLADKYYKGNEGLDVNNDKKITKAEIAQKIQRFHDKGKR